MPSKKEGHYQGSKLKDKETIVQTVIGEKLKFGLKGGRGEIVL